MDCLRGKFGKLFFSEQAAIGSVDLDLFVLLGLAVCRNERKNNEPGAKRI